MYITSQGVMMPDKQAIPECSAAQPVDLPEPGRKLKFSGDNAFHQELRRRVDRTVTVHAAVGHEDDDAV